MDSFCENSGSGKSIVEELISKKVRFRDKEEETSNSMMIDLSSVQPTSWRDKLVGHSAEDVFIGSKEKEAIDILEEDIQKTFANGVPSIIFSDQIHQIIIKGMDNTVILKLLGRNIGFSILQNKIYNMWRPSVPLYIMDIENGYFLVKFQNKLDCEKALSEGPFPALPSYLYNRKIITKIGELVGKVVKLDMNIDRRVRGYFSRMAVYVNLEKLLVSQILINDRSQKVEYKSLSTICFHCGRYGHVENLYTFRKHGLAVEKKNDSPETTPENQNLVEEGSAKKDENYGLWMIVERKSKRKSRDNVQKSDENPERENEGSRFSGLNNRYLNKEIYDEDLSNFQSSKEKGIINGNQHRKEFGSYYNGQTNLNKNNKKRKFNEVGPKTGLSSIIKDHAGSKVGSSLAPNRANEILKISENLTKGLGLGDISANQAGDLMD
ncbi:hypothetical protein Godav_024422 [Gossypium davidsonii]|uniref:DUF4283 domain-containing protein n=1 Tax=Gossypium davidsonii TaxID=34287 RepID=A0A7J8T976_GOSDV|nr:hypothetical protein [Gossypium davidsonii]